MIANISKEILVQKLVEEGKLSKAEARECGEIARKQNKTIFQLFHERGFLGDEDLTEFLSQELQIPRLNLAALRVPKEIIKLIPKKVVERYQILPLSRIQNLLTVATSNPFEIMLYDDLKELTNCEVSLVLVPPKVIAGAMDDYYSEFTNLETLLQDIDENKAKTAKEGKGEAAPESKIGEEPPVVKMVNLILHEALRVRASDIHFEPFEKDFRVRYRIDGALKESFARSRELYASLVARIKIMAQLNITEKRLPQDGRFRVNLQNREIDFRVSILPTYHGEKIVLRVLDKAGVKAGLSKLGFSEKPTTVFAEAIKHPYGMILVTGPTGSGKSTTLYTILSTMNTPERNIMTVEDPVEYQIQGITQTQVQAEIGLTFANGLRALLRQSPDIVLVGEIRDTETADIGVKAALTGHLVFSTLHTNSAAGAMTRLIDMGVEPFLIASSVICVAAQRLMRQICPRCKEPNKISEEVLRRCKIKNFNLPEGAASYKGKGCSACNHTGYYGRIGTIEVLKMEPEIRDLVLKRKSSDVIERVAIEKGMETLFENAFGIFEKGLTTLEEVLRVSSKE